MRKKALAHSQDRERTCSSQKYFEASITIGMGGMDIDMVLLVKSRKFIEECMGGLCSMEGKYISISN
jgi:hypothetical protein